MEWNEVWLRVVKRFSDATKLKRRVARAECTSSHILTYSLSPKVLHLLPSHAATSCILFVML